MKYTVIGYTLIEVLVVLATVTVLVGIAATYKINDADKQLAEMDFKECYLAAKNILTHAQSLHLQGFRSSDDLSIAQLQAKTRNSRWQAGANQIRKIADSHSEGDFKLRFNITDIQVKFVVDDDVVMNGYPLQRQHIVGDKDIAILSKVVQAERSRVLKFNDYLAD